MEAKKIETKKEYEAALERFEAVFQAVAGTPESDEADALALIIKNYEEQLVVANNGTYIG